jgi:hypothetical protein
MPKHCETLLHSHARLSSALWSARMLEAHRESQIHGQANRISRGNAAIGRATRCPLAHYKLFEKVS